MKYKLIFSILTICITIGCKTTNDITSPNLNYLIINSFLNHYKTYSITSTTIKPDFNSLGIPELHEIDISRLLHLNISLNTPELKFEDIFTPENIKEVNLGFQKLKAQKLMKKYIEEPSRIKSNAKSKNTRKISEPVITKNKKYTFIYSEGKSDGELLCMEFIDNEWVPLFVAPVWSTD